MKVTLSEMEQIKPLVIPVIGPTNEGKTSVLRTLTGDPDFGEVNALTGTTKRVIYQKVFYKGREILQLIDTPGFQMSGDILDRLEEATNNTKEITPESIIQVIPPHDPNYAHDLRAWKSVLSGDIVIFVANVMESPYQSLVQDTLTLLTDSQKPIIVIFNNVSKEKQKEQEGNPPTPDFQDRWIEELKKRRIHLWQIYDAHHRSFNNETELFEKILVHIQNPLMQKVFRLELQERSYREHRRLKESRAIIVKLLLDAANFHVSAKEITEENKSDKIRDLVSSLNEAIYIMEHNAHLEILKAWDFHAGILDRAALQVEHTEKEAKDLFSEDAWKHYTRGGAWGAGIGGGIGLCLDVALGGLSLGTGTAIGSLIGGFIGGGINGFHHFQYDKYQKIITIGAQKELLFLLLARSVELVRKLQSRGKALEDGVQVLVSKTPELINDKTIVNLLSKISHNFSDSYLTKGKRLFFGEKSLEQDEYAALLMKSLEQILQSHEEL